MADTGELITLRAVQKSSLYATMLYVPGTTSTNRRVRGSQWSYSICGLVAQADGPESTK